MSKGSPKLFDTAYPFFLVATWIAFFVAQVTIKHEIPLTFIAILMTGVLFLKYEAGEPYLFLFGVLVGLIIEVGLGLIARTQHWEYASFLGVPYWLPLVWGYGFVVMRRIGNTIVSLASRTDVD